MTNDTFQRQVQRWVVDCFGESVARDPSERNRRFLEESLELAQSLGCRREIAHQIVDYVFNRTPGEPWQETGGVMITLASLCETHSIDMQKAGCEELARVSAPEIVQKIKVKHALKPKFQADNL